MANTITASRACERVGYRWAIVGNDQRGEYVYGLYPSEDEARRIASDLNDRHENASYYAAEIVD